MPPCDSKKQTETYPAFINKLLLFSQFAFSKVYRFPVGARKSYDKTFK